MTYLKVQCNHFYWWPLSPKLEALDGDTSDEIFAGIAQLKRTSIDLCLALLTQLEGSSDTL
jgi:hypothetical protein